MSGIAGLYYLDSRPVQRSSIQLMVDALKHRGPDGTGVWTDGAVGMGHRMLWTTPESLHETLPLVDRELELAITCDARIDNRDELFDALHLSSSDHGEISDSQLILAAYATWGEDCPCHLLGDFAFAVWDISQQKLFCARDHFGIKPCYYHHQPGRLFAFASEIKGLFTLPQVPRRLNEERVAQYLIADFNDQAVTFYQDVLRLPPAHRLSITASGLALTSYYELSKDVSLTLGSDEEYAARFQTIFKEAVRCRMRSAFRVGALLSGGLDSSSVACVARDLSQEKQEGPLATISAVYPGVPECDEQSFINLVLEQGGFEPHYVQGDQRGPLTLIDEILWHEDEVFMAPGLGGSWKLHQEARKQGVRVLLDGHGGDETVSHGSELLKELKLKKRWLPLYRELKGLARNDLLSGLSPGRMVAGFILNQRPLGKMAVRAGSACRRGLRSLARRHQPVSPQEHDWSHLINPDFIDRFRLAERHRQWQDLAAKAATTEKEAHYRTLSGGLQAYALEVIDKAAAAGSVEARYPLWDKRLVEFCLSVPSGQKLKLGWGRHILRRAMQGILPPRVQWRNGKVDFTANISRGLLKFDRERLEQAFVDNRALVEPYVAATDLEDAYARITAPGSDVKRDDLYGIMTMAVLSLWLGRIQSLLHQEFASAELEPSEVAVSTSALASNAANPV